MTMTQLAPMPTHPAVTVGSAEDLRVAASRIGDARVTVAHDYVTQRGGAERVTLALLQAFPAARLMTSVYQPGGSFQAFRGHDVTTSWLQRIPGVNRDPRLALPLLPRVWKNMAVGDDTDVVVASSTGFAHSVRTRARKVVYCHNPPRWLYQRDNYLLGQPRGVRAGLAALSPYLHREDQRAAASADRYLANSTSVAQRIKTAYGIDAPVVFPPVMVDRYAEREPVAGVDPGFYLLVARGRGYKNSQVACHAVQSLPGARLVVVGGLPQRSDGRQWCSRITGVQDISDASLRWLYANCRGLIAPSFEDFGLTPVEAAAFGKPTIALRAGGYLDTVRGGLTGVFADDLSADSFAAAIERSQRHQFNADYLMAHARSFGLERFVFQMHQHVADVLDQ
jgi:glycosyltransferase involved in cell wall biosynthesis